MKQPVPRNVRRVFTVSAVILVISFLLSGCSHDDPIGGDGRGDFTIDLRDGYGISKINSYEIMLTHKENPNDSGGTIVIPNYFVTGYQLHTHYICLEGVRTQGTSATQEEIHGKGRSYYLVDTVSGEVSDPYESFRGFQAFCGSVPLTVEDEWIRPNE